MATPEQQLATMMANIPDKTGQTLEAWKDVLAQTDLEKHGQIVKYLKTDHGVTHGFANLIAKLFLDGDQAQPTEDDLVAAQYSGAKASLKPIYHALVELAQAFGEDVEIAPKKASVSLRRKKQFALIVPATKTRIDLGLSLKGEEASGRLEPYNAMCSHRIRIESLEDIDETVKQWMTEAYTRAG